MSESNLKELEDDINDDVSWFCNIKGVNKKCIVEYVKQLAKCDINFELIPISWITSTILRDNINDEEVGLSLVDCFVSKEDFEDKMSDDFRVVNPVIYELARQAAFNIDIKLVTVESRIEYFSGQLEVNKRKFENTTDEFEMEYFQSIIDYYTELLQKLSLKKKK